MEALLAPFALLMVTSAILGAFCLLVLCLFPRLGFLECAFIAPCVGLSVSPWIALLLKSFPLMGSGVSLQVVFFTLMVQCGIVVVTQARVRAILLRERERIFAELRLHRGGLIALGIMAAWWWYMNHIHYLMRMGSTHIAGGSAWLIHRTGATPAVRCWHEWSPCCRRVRC